jgi:hypothetical protein
MAEIVHDDNRVVSIEKFGARLGAGVPSRRQSNQSSRLPHKKNAHWILSGTILRETEKPLLQV